MIRVVVDTNVLVSALLKDSSLEASLLRLVLGRKLISYISAPVLAEYEFVLRREKFLFTQSLIDQILTGIRRVAVMVQPSHTLLVSPDEADNRFLECAEEAKADYLVTGNKRHFPKTWKGTRVVNGRELLEIITPDLQR